MAYYCKRCKTYTSLKDGSMVYIPSKMSLLMYTEIVFPLWIGGRNAMQINRILRQRIMGPGNEPCA